MSIACKTNNKMIKVKNPIKFLHTHIHEQNCYSFCYSQEHRDIEAKRLHLFLLDCACVYVFVCLCNACFSIRNSYS